MKIRSSKDTMVETINFGQRLLFFNKNLDFHTDELELNKEKSIIYLCHSLHTFVNFKLEYMIYGDIHCTCTK